MAASETCWARMERVSGACDRSCKVSQIRSPGQLAAAAASMDNRVQTERQFILERRFLDTSLNDLCG